MAIFFNKIEMALPRDPSVKKWYAVLRRICNEQCTRDSRLRGNDGRGAI